MSLIALYLRSFVYTALLFVSFVVLCSIAVLPYPIMNEQRRWRVAVLWSETNLYFLKNICGLRYILKGEENIPSEKCVVFFKHSSVVEAFVGLKHFSPSSWVAKYELMYVPLFRGAIKRFGLIPVKRGLGKSEVEKVVGAGKKRLLENKWIIIFPEGTRMPYKQTKKYGLSGALLAKGANVAVLPISHNSGKYWKRRGLLKHPGTIVFSIGKPIKTKGKNIADINKEAQSWIESEIRVFDKD